jgi:hypothetical protein
MNTLIPCSDSVINSLYSDLWHFRALGKTAESVWKILIAKDETSIEYVQLQTGRSRRSINLALNKLWKTGMAYPLGKNYWVGVPIDEEDLVRITKYFGTFGERQKMILRHQQERSHYAASIILSQKRRWEQRAARRANEENSR